MTRLAVADMADADEIDNARRARRIGKIGLLAFLTLLLAGVSAGFTKASLEHASGIDAVRGAIIALLVLLTLFTAWRLIRVLDAPTGEAPPTRKERLNRNLLLVCGGMGFFSGLLMMFVDNGADLTRGILSNEPLPPGIAIALLVLMGVVLPIVSYIWHHRAVDEQEVAAYKDGALWGLNVFMLGAPIWWTAWRGGFLPAPDGIIIYFATITIVGVVWMWKKYR